MFPLLNVIRKAMLFQCAYSRRRRRRRLSPQLSAQSKPFRHCYRREDNGGFGGEFPCALFDFPYLQVLRFSDNQQYGPFFGRVDVCRNICTNRSLVVLDLSNNRLYGTIVILTFLIPV